MGPVRSNNRKFVPPPRSELGVSMESLIHHFKLWTEGFSAPKGSVYVTTESPRGELGVYMESDGTPKPLRVHYHTPYLCKPANYAAAYPAVISWPMWLA